MMQIKYTLVLILVILAIVIYAKNMYVSLISSIFTIGILSNQREDFGIDEEKIGRKVTKRYSCIDSQCVLSGDGQFGSLRTCKAHCGQNLFYDIERAKIINMQIFDFANIVDRRLLTNQPLSGSSLNMIYSVLNAITKQYYSWIHNLQGSMNIHPFPEVQIENKNGFHYVKNNDLPKGKYILIFASKIASMFAGEYGDNIDDYEIEMEFYDYMETVYDKYSRLKSLRNAIEESDDKDKIIYTAHYIKYYERYYQILVDSDRKYMSSDDAVNTGISKMNGRHFVIPIGVYGMSGSGSGHANALVISKSNDSNEYLTVELFEPHGTSCVKESEEFKKLYKFIEDDIGKKTDANYEGLIDIFIGPQAFEGQSKFVERCPISSTDKNDGFCLAWSMYFATIRLMYPNYDNSEIARSMILYNRDNKYFVLSMADKPTAETIKDESNIRLFSFIMFIMFIYDYSSPQNMLLYDLRLTDEELINVKNIFESIRYKMNKGIFNGTLLSNHGINLSVNKYKNIDIGSYYNNIVTTFVAPQYEPFYRRDGDDDEEDVVTDAEMKVWTFVDESNSRIIDEERQPYLKESEEKMDETD
jgi:hypothetical protein